MQGPDKGSPSIPLRLHWVGTGVVLLCLFVSIAVFLNASTSPPLYYLLLWVSLPFLFSILPMHLRRDSATTRVSYILLVSVISILVSFV
ncbi:MAG TPA: hypothetical protein PKO06_06210, partial [Candidatus Ozemobacteraceae bacterium]|nr:hypothetical protein [Candidatus Ozemobacteraceae bacterium]